MRRVNIRWLPHTADLRLEIQANTQRELFATAMVAMMRRMVEGTIQSRSRRTLDCQGLDCSSLLVNMLNQAIALFDREGFLVGQVLIDTLGTRHLRVTLVGERYKPQRHRMKTLFKAATYHRLSLTKCGKGWRAEVIFDV
jgi:SHS2 domain-containing protein